jgi:hypothetical protein
VIVVIAESILVVSPIDPQVDIAPIRARRSVYNSTL